MTKIKEVVSFVDRNLMVLAGLVIFGIAAFNDDDFNMLLGLIFFSYGMNSIERREIHRLIRRANVRLDNLEKER